MQGTLKDRISATDEESEGSEVRSSVERSPPLHEGCTSLFLLLGFSLLGLLLLTDLCLKAVGVGDGLRLLTGTPSSTEKQQQEFRTNKFSLGGRKTSKKVTIAFMG